MNTSSPAHPEQLLQSVLSAESAWRREGTLREKWAAHRTRLARGPLASCGNRNLWGNAATSHESVLLLKAPAGHARAWFSPPGRRCPVARSWPTGQVLGRVGLEG